MKQSYELDLSALAYPMMKSSRAQSVFRFSAQLTNPVDPTLLAESLTDVLAYYPALKTRVAPSFFWHKLKPNDAPLLVKEDDRQPLTPFRKEDTHDYPFRLAYRGEEIVIEFFHAATDGNVGVLFLCDLLTRYAERKEGLAPHGIDRALCVQDGFLSYARKKSLFKVSLKKYNGKAAFALGSKDNYLPSPVLLSHGIPVAELKSAAKSYGATLTEYVVACYVAALLEGATLPLDKPVAIFLPIDLRRFFPSKTMQNFVCFERIVLEKGESDTSFPHLIAIVREEFAQKITKERMQEHVDDVASCFTFPPVNYLPLFVKQPLFKLGKLLSNKVRQTSILTNVGEIPLPSDVTPFVKSVKFFSNVNRNAPLNVGLVSCGDVCAVSVTCLLKETPLPERFFALLHSQGKK